MAQKAILCFFRVWALERERGYEWLGVRKMAVVVEGEREWRIYKGYREGIRGKVRRKGEMWGNDVKMWDIRKL